MNTGKQAALNIRIPLETSKVSIPYRKSYSGSWVYLFPESLSHQTVLGLSSGRRGKNEDIAGCVMDHTRSPFLWLSDAIMYSRMLY